MTVKFALPAGDSRAAIASMLEAAGVATRGYEPGSRQLRNILEEAGLTLRAFREKDIPIQVALGNYDLGICSDVWLRELQARFPQQRIVPLGSLPGARDEVWLCAAPGAGLSEGQVPGGQALAGARIVSELPNLADVVCMHLRIPAYRLLPVYGSADAYPPEDADLVVMAAANAAAVREKGLVPLHRVFEGGTALIANADSLVERDLAPVLSRLSPLLAAEQPALSLPAISTGVSIARAERDTSVLRLALPDGHAQRFTPAALLEAGLQFEGYDAKAFIRRPLSDIPGLAVKVVRPQDMPQLVAMGLFDLAVTGRDLLHEHLCRFPGSPAVMAIDLGRNRYRIGPVVDAAFPAETTLEAVAIWNALGRPVRIASEFPATAEKFARDHHLAYTTIIPVAGASEGFVPEDADVLIEGSETGASIRANGLKMLDPFMESTNCVIIRREPVTTRTELLGELLAKLRTAAAAAMVG
ncbi:MAG: ATP phosphoribosyltransferase [Tepidiformaceae bacterium]